MTLTESWTLAVATVAIAGTLLLEHSAVKGRDVPRRLSYAIGLVTVLGGLMLWAALLQVTVTAHVSVAMLLAGCASGIPDFLVLWREQVQSERKWQALEATNAELAAQLRLLLSKPVNSKYMSRLRQMVETAAFATASMRQERELIEVAERQAEALLAEIQEIVGGAS